MLVIDCYMQQCVRYGGGGGGGCGGCVCVCESY